MAAEACIQRGDGVGSTSLRKCASVDRDYLHDSLGQRVNVADGEEVTILAAEGDFLLVKRHGGEEGYIRSNYVKPLGDFPMAERDGPPQDGPVQEGPTQPGKACDCPHFLYVAPDGSAQEVIQQPKPEGALRFVCISDTHTREARLKLPSGDVLIHAGDALYRNKNREGKEGDLTELDMWMAEQDCPTRLLIGGNHDKCLQDFGRDEARKALSHCTYLEDELFDIDGVRIYASPISLPYEVGGKTLNCAFQSPPELDERCHGFNGAIDQRIAAIPDMIDILVTHGPPKEQLDNPFGKHLGSPGLAHRVRQTKPKFHVFGHIHNPSLRAVMVDGTVYINACSVEDFSNPHEQGGLFVPIVFDVLKS